MMKLSLCVIVFVLVSSSQYVFSQAKDINKVSEKINLLAKKNDSSSLSELIKEANKLVKSKDENFVLLAYSIFSFLQDETEKYNVERILLRRFPHGIMARHKAYENLFTDKSASAYEIENKYKNFINKFPIKNFGESGSFMYDFSIVILASHFYQEDNFDKGNEYLNLILDKAALLSTAHHVIPVLFDKRKYDILIPILERVVKLASKERNKNPGYFREYASYYGRVLVELDRSEEAIEVLEDLLQTNDNEIERDAYIALANAYSKIGRDLDAFYLLDELFKSGRNIDVELKLKALYEKLNSGKSDFSSYIANLDEIIKKNLIAKYQPEMVKKVAPNFILKNLEGQTVSLEDLRGKVVVLDFWATWCGPCKMSFPGMQSAVNKYKEDGEVVFLFINCLQTEKNYKDIVKKFIDENEYTFNVVFDEMNNKSASTTTAYGVTGIPHKVIIDKEGFIRFETSGSSSDIDKIVNELETKIELARKG